MKKIEFFLLILILLGAFAVRLYKFSSPIADWHSWRQSDTSSVSRNFIKYGFDILHPRFDDLSNGVSLLDNPQGYRFTEFPIYNIFQAGLFKLFGHFTIEEWGRLVTIFSSIVAIIFLYLIVKKYISIRAALFAAFFYAFVPYNIYYGRTILPDPFMISMMLGGIYFFDRWIDDHSKINFRFFLAILFITIAILIKPFVLFFALPFIYLAVKRYGLGFIKNSNLWIFFIFSITPFILWRLWMSQYPEGIPRNDWLFNGNHIRFTGAFFWWIFAERISKFILGYFGLPVVILGLLVKINEKVDWFFFTFIISSLLYFTVIATGNVQHDYYQILIIPTLALFFAKGAEAMLCLPKEYVYRKVSLVILGLCSIFMVLFGWHEIRSFYTIQHSEIIQAGIAVDALTPKDAKVIAVYNGDTTFLYHTNRRGWPVVERSFKDFKKAGASYITFVNPTKDELNLGNFFETVVKTNNYAIFNLTKQIKPLK